MKRCHIKESARQILKFYPIILSGGFWYFTMFPGVMTPDSHYTILQSRGEVPLNSLHTIAFSLYVKFFSINGNAIYVVTLVSLVLSMTALYGVIRLIFINNSQKFTICLTALIFLTPFFGPFAVSIWKDNVYTSVTIIGLVFIVKHCKNPLQDKGSLFLGFGCLTIGSLFRGEGFILVTLLGLLISVFTLAKSISVGKYVGLVLVASGAISFLLQNTVNNKFDELPKPTYQNSFAFLLDLQYVNSVRPELLQPTTKKILDEISSGPSLKSAGSCTAPWDFLGEGFNQESANAYHLKILGLWLDELKLDARETLLSARYCKVKAIIPFPFGGIPTASWWPTIGISPNNFGYTHPAFTTYIYPIGYAWTYLWRVNGNLLAWPGLHLSFVIFFIFFTRLGRKYRSRNIFKLLFLLVSIRFSTFLIVAGSQEYRYYQMIYYLSIPFLAYIILNKFRESNTRVIQN